MESHNCNAIDWLKENRATRFDFLITDPSWGNGKIIKHGSAGKVHMVRQANGNVLEVNRQDVAVGWNNQRPPGEFWTLLNVGDVIIKGGDHFSDYLPAGTQWLIWDKCSGNSDQGDAELIYTSLNPGSPPRILRYMWSGFMQGKSIEEGHIQRGNKKTNEKRMGIACYTPVNLWRMVLQRCVPGGSTMIDPFAGSHSLQRAAMIENHLNGMDYSVVSIEKVTDTWEKAQILIKKTKAWIADPYDKHDIF